jgi:hypothetical protein
MMAAMGKRARAALGIWLACSALVGCSSSSAGGLTPVVSGGRCSDLPAVVCGDAGLGADFSAVSCDSAVAACSPSEDGCRKASFAFDGEGCLKADSVGDWDAHGTCLETALRSKRWPAMAGQTMTVHESCMPGVSCSLSPRALGRVHSRARRR